MSNPGGELRFTEDHDWLRREPDGTVVIGITDYAQQQLGDVVYVQLPEIGRHYDTGEEAAVVESVKAASGIKLPLAGTVVAVNDEIVATPATINRDPQGAGWFMRLQPDQPGQLASLMDAAAYARHTGNG
jgi:glycine cleavage system H protein